MAHFDAPVPLLPEILSLHGKWQATKTAVICGQTKLNWSSFCNNNHQFSHALLANGISPGDRVGIVMSNSVAMLHALFGTMAAGAVSVPINLSVTDEALISMLKDADIKALVVTQDQEMRLVQLSKELPESLVLRITDGKGDSDWINIHNFCEGQSTELPSTGIQADDPLSIIYSSGTTGLPKGILHTHRTRRDWAYDLTIALRYHSATRALLTIGLYSNISWVAMLCTLVAGGTLVIHKSFDAKQFLQTVAEEKITHTAMVPVQFQRVIEQLRAEVSDVSSMQAMMSCGSPLREGLKKDIFSSFPCGVIELYGLTEGIITTLDSEDADGRWNSVGRPLQGTDICIIDDSGLVCAKNTAGEIVSRGRITMPGYWKRDDANQDAEFIDAQGQQWLRSGDIGYIDDEGFLYIVDRKKDMILSGGQNIYPQDIEAVLVQHPEVIDAAVIAASSKRWGETPIALVVPAEGAQTTTKNILLWANERLGRQQRLTDLLFVQELPRNPNGKILKRELRIQFGDLDYE